MKTGLLKVLLLLFVGAAAVHGLPGVEDTEHASVNPNFSDEDHPEY